MYAKILISQMSHLANPQVSGQVTAIHPNNLNIDHPLQVSRNLGVLARMTSAPPVYPINQMNINKDINQQNEHKPPQFIRVNTEQNCKTTLLSSHQLC